MGIQLSFWIEMIATAAFAITAVLALANRGVDLFGALVLGVITAVGGGTIRDLILGVKVFWAVDQSYLWLALAASAATFAFRPLFRQRLVFRTMLYIDALGAALFGVQASAKVWDSNFGVPLAPVILGVITAIGGSLVRDVLAGHRTILMSRELYAVPVTAGCVTFAAMSAYAPQLRDETLLISIAIIFFFRAAAIHWNLQVPERLITKPRS